MHAELERTPSASAPASEAARCVRIGQLPRPAAPATPPAGSGRLEVARVAGESAAVRCISSSPLRLLLPRPRGRTVWAVAASHGGGLVGGDAVQVEVDVGPGARACLTTQAETKVYRSPEAPGQQALRARVGPGAVLAVLPEPVSPYAGASYRQHQALELAAGGNLVLLDGVTAGRSARGERWAARSIETRNEITIDGRLVLADSVALLADRGPPVAERMRDFDLLATLVVLGPLFASAAAALLATIDARTASRAPVLAAASALGDGLHLRLAARTVEAGMAELRSLLGWLPAILGEDPLSRRP